MAKYLVLLLSLLTFTVLNGEAQQNTDATTVALPPAAPPREHGGPPIHLPPKSQPPLPPPHHQHHNHTGHHKHHNHTAHPPMAHPPMAHPPMKPPPKKPYPPMMPPKKAPVPPPKPSPTPAKPPMKPPPYHPVTRSFVAVQGVVYCKSCKYSGVETLVGATPASGVIVELACNNTKYTTRCKGTTDKNGYFWIQAPKTITSYGAHKCKVYLVSSPNPTCNKPSDLHGGLTGAILRPEKPFEVAKMPFFLYTVGPFAFEPKCPKLI